MENGKMVEKRKWNMFMVKDTSEWQNLMDIDNNQSNFTFYFPTYVPTGSTEAFDEYPFERIIRSPGLAVISQAVSTNRADQITDALKSAWPFLLMVILLATVAGFIAWICEFHHNADQFPSSFFNGSWQGFWWAMVTMTTVGYGDKAPVTIPGRVLTVIWMLSSSVIVSILTAHITSSLTTDDIDISNSQSYIGAEMGIHVGSKYYFQNGFNIGANYKEISTTAEAIDALNNGSLQRFLSDNYLTATTSKMKLKIETIYQEPLDVGIAVVGGKECTGQCTLNFDKYLSCLGKITRKHIIKKTDSLQDTSVPDTDNSEYFNTEEMKIILYCLAGIIGATLLCGGLWEQIKIIKNKRALKDQSDPRDVEMGLQQFKTGLDNFSYR